jgi:hypothetical protein
MIILYLVLTVAGLFLFHGIPVFNVAAGFPVGAAAAWLALARKGGPGDGEPGADPPEALPGPVAARGSDLLEALKAAISWAMISSAATVVLCWVQLGAMLAVSRFWGPYSPAARWVPLLPPPAVPAVSRMLFFAVITAPALQMLSTAFGGLITVLVCRTDSPQDSAR